MNIQIDAKNQGDWINCVSINNLTLPSNFVNKAHIGITASTGQLADNHDVLSLLSYSDSAVMHNEEQAGLEKVKFETAEDMGAIDRLLR